MSKYEQVVVKGDAYWASFKEVNSMSGKYQVDICNLDDATVSKLESKGIIIKTKTEKPEQGRFITAKSQFAPSLFNADKTDFPTEKLVGNGSTVKVAVSVVPWDNKFGRGITAGLESAMIINLNEYTEDFDPTTAVKEEQPPFDVDMFDDDGDLD